MSIDTSPDDSIKPPTEDGRVKNFFGHCFEISRLNQGDKIPVGGTNLLTDETDIKVMGDFENLEEFFGKAHGVFEQCDLLEVKTWLHSMGVEINDKLFAVLFAFTKTFEQKYPKNPTGATTRHDLYTKRDEELKLSDIFENNCAECTEVAALAQFFLQREGISSSLFGGDVLWSKDREFSEEHSFIVIRGIMSNFGCYSH